MRKFVIVGAVLASAALAAAGCDQKLSDVAGPTPALEPTFASIQREIFNAPDSAGRTACIGCHTDQGRNPAAGLVLLEGRSHAQLVGVAARNKPGAIRVVAGDPNASYLVHKLEGTPGIVGQRMPFGTGPYLTEGQMRILRRWIELGAKND